MNGSYAPGSVETNVASSFARAWERAGNMPSPAEYAIRYLVESEGLSISEAKARMKACVHPNVASEDSMFDGTKFFTCPDCGFVYDWLYVETGRQLIRIRRESQEIWPTVVDRVAADYQRTNQGDAPEPPS